MKKSVAMVAFVILLGVETPFVALQMVREGTTFTFFAISQSFAMDKEEKIRMLNEAMKEFELGLSMCNERPDPASCVKDCTDMIAVFQAEIDKLRKEVTQAEKAYKADCGVVDPNRTNPFPPDQEFCPGNLVCITNFCGGGMGCPYVCCPKGLPYLNHCDCKCHATSDFDCHSHSNCKEKPKQ